MYSQNDATFTPVFTAPTVLPGPTAGPPVLHRQGATVVDEEALN